jgi:hypothetical protein
MKNRSREEAESKGVDVVKQVSGLAIRGGDHVTANGYAHEKKNPAAVHSWFKQIYNGTEYKKYNPTQKSYKKNQEKIFDTEYCYRDTDFSFFTA